MTTITQPALWSVSSVRQEQSIALCPISLKQILIATSPLRLDLPNSSSLFRLHKNIKEISEGINHHTTCVFTSRFFIFYTIYNEKIFSCTNKRHQPVASRQLATPNVPAQLHSDPANRHLTVNCRDNGSEKPGLNGGQRGYATRLMILK